MVKVVVRIFCNTTNCKASTTGYLVEFATPSDGVVAYESGWTREGKSLATYCPVCSATKSYQKITIGIRHDNSLCEKGATMTNNALGNLQAWLKLASPGLRWLRVVSSPSLPETFWE